MRRAPSPSNNCGKRQLDNRSLHRALRHVAVVQEFPSQMQCDRNETANLCAATLELRRRLFGDQHVQGERVELRIARVAPAQLPHTVPQPGTPLRLRMSRRDDKDKQVKCRDESIRYNHDLSAKAVLREATSRSVVRRPVHHLTLYRRDLRRHTNTGPTQASTNRQTKETHFHASVCPTVSKHFFTRCV